MVTTELPLLPLIATTQGAVALIPLSPAACLNSVIVREVTFRCRPDHSILVGVEVQARPGTYPVTTSAGIIIASLDITPTPWPKARRPAGAAGAPAPKGRIEQDRAAKGAAYQSHVTKWASYHLQAPLREPINASYRVSESFGLHRFYGASTIASIHGGDDLAAPMRGGWNSNPPSAQSMASGVVVLAQSLWLEGNTVIVYHGDNVYTTYCHLSTIRVAVNDLIPAGRSLGSIGSTGRSSGVHLHLAMRIGNVNVSPLQARDTLNRFLR